MHVNLFRETQQRLSTRRTAETTHLHTCSIIYTKYVVCIHQAIVCMNGTTLFAPLPMQNLTTTGSPLKSSPSYFLAAEHIYNYLRLNDLIVVDHLDVCKLMASIFYFAQLKRLQPPYLCEGMSANVTDRVSEIT